MIITVANTKSGQIEGVYPEANYGTAHALNLAIQRQRERRTAYSSPAILIDGVALNGEQMAAFEGRCTWQAALDFFGMEWPARAA